MKHRDKELQLRLETVLKQAARNRPLPYGFIQDAAYLCTGVAIAYVQERANQILSLSAIEDAIDRLVQYTDSKYKEIQS